MTVSVAKCVIMPSFPEVLEVWHCPHPFHRDLIESCIFFLQWDIGVKANPGRIMGNIGSRAVDQKNINIRPTEILIDFDHCFLFVLFYFPFTCSFESVYRGILTDALGRNNTYNTFFLLFFVFMVFCWFVCFLLFYFVSFKVFRFPL